MSEQIGELEDLKMLTLGMMCLLYTKEDFLKNGVNAASILSRMKAEGMTADEEEEEDLLDVIKITIYTILVEMTDQTTKIIDA